MVKRVRGYHYARRRDGSKYRVYSNSRRATGRRAKGYTAGRRGKRYSGYTSAMSGKKVIGGMGAYYKKGGRAFNNGVTSLNHNSNPFARPYNKGVRMGEQAPIIKNSNGRFIVCHQEYIGDVLASANFVNTTFYINPALPLGEGGFNIWLNLVAQQFEEWAPRGMAFHYKSTSSDAVLATGASSALGTVSMATSYNAINPPFTSKLQMENYEGATSAKPSVDQTHFIECNPKKNPIAELFTRVAPTGANQDIRLFDLGIFQLAVSGCQNTGANQTIGELWVSYEIELFKPRVNPAPNIAADHFIIPAATAGLVPATPMGTTIQTTIPAQSTTGQTFTTVGLPPTTSSTLNGTINGGAANGKYSFNTGIGSGQYLVLYHGIGWTAGTQSSAASWTVVGTNCNSSPASFTNDALSLVGNSVSGGNCQQLYVAMMITVTAQAASFTITSTSGMTGPPAGAQDLFIIQVPTGLK